MEWLKKLLKDAGLDDSKVDETVGSIKKELPEHFIPKDKYNSTADELKGLKEQISDRDKQLEELSGKAKGNEELQEQIKQLQEQNKTTQAEYEQKLQEQQFDFALEKNLSAAKVKNIKAVKALLDMDTIKLDGDSLKGLEDQLNKIKESDSYLFAEESNGPKPKFTGGEHKKTDPTEADAWLEAFKPPSFGNEK